MRTIALVLTVLVAATVEAQQYYPTETVPGTTGTMVTCESKNNVRHTCKVDARGRMVTINQQLSDNPCVVGRTWGVNRNRKSIWVDDGCRAEFLVGVSGIARQAFGRSLTCESVNNGKRRCPADTSYGVQLARQISRNECTRGEDWGFDENGIWVDNGCRGEFVLGGDTRFTPMVSSARTRLVCESQNNALNRCAADTFYGVTLERQISNKMCVRGQTWGYDPNGIWVTGGCRAEFVLGQ
jgi:hypothetical protein